VSPDKTLQGTTEDATFDANEHVPGEGLSSEDEQAEASTLAQTTAVVKVATSEDKEYNDFVSLAKKTRSRFFCPDTFLIPKPGELLIEGVGDVDVMDKRQRIVTGKFGIYVYEVDMTTGARVACYVYLEDIKRDAKEGIPAIKAMSDLFSKSMTNRQVVPYGLKGHYLTLARKTKSYLDQLPNQLDESCHIHEAKWDFLTNDVGVVKEYIKLQLTGNEMASLQRFLQMTNILTKMPLLSWSHEIKESFISDIIPKTCLPGWISLYSGQALKDIYYPDTTLIQPHFHAFTKTGC
jgi:hypothetical protein